MARAKAWAASPAGQAASRATLGGAEPRAGGPRGGRHPGRPRPSRKPSASRIHLATDNRIRSEDMVRITREELGVNVRLTDPTHLPQPDAAPGEGGAHAAERAEARERPREAGDHLRRVRRVGPAHPRRGQRRALAGPALEAPRHPARLPHALSPQQATCRTSARSGTPTRSPGESCIWDHAIDAIEMDSGHEVASIGPEEFRELLEAEVDLRTFRPRQRPSRPREIEDGRAEDADGSTRSTPPMAGRQRSKRSGLRCLRAHPFRKELPSERTAERL